MGNQGGMVTQYSAEKQLEKIMKNDFVIATWNSPAFGKQAYFGFYDKTNYDAEKTGWIKLQNLGKAILVDSSTTIQKIADGTKARLTLDYKTLYKNQIKGNPLETAVSFVKKEGTPMIQFVYEGKTISIGAENVERFEVVKSKPAEQDGFIRKKK